MAASLCADMLGNVAGAGQLLVPYIGLIVYLGVVGYFGYGEDNPSRYRRLGARQPKGKDRAGQERAGEGRRGRERAGEGRAGKGRNGLVCCCDSHALSSSDMSSSLFSSLSLSSLVLVLLHYTCRPASRRPPRNRKDSACPCDCREAQAPFLLRLRLPHPLHDPPCLLPLPSFPFLRLFPWSGSHFSPDVAAACRTRTMRGRLTLLPQDPILLKCLSEEEPLASVSCFLVPKRSSLPLSPASSLYISLPPPALYPPTPPTCLSSSFLLLFFPHTYNNFRLLPASSSWTSSMR
eukprot:761888-Hanusia_phi.AAC.1